MLTNAAISRAYEKGQKFMADKLISAMGATEGCPVCDGFTEMHSSEEQEIYVWNRRAEDG